MDETGASCPPNLFGLLKRELEPLIFVSMSCFSIFKDCWFDEITPGKKKQIDTHP